MRTHLSGGGDLRDRRIVLQLESVETVLMGQDVLLHAGCHGSMEINHAL